MPSNLALGTERSGDPARRAWLQALPGVVGELARRWQLRLGEPFEPGGTCSWVAPARDAAGRDAVLKVAWRHWEARDEAAGMAAWAGAGAAEVFALDDQAPASSSAGGGGGTTALLLERCRPGTPLTALPVSEQHDVVGALLRRLHAAPLPTGHGFRPLTSMCDAWGASAERGHAQHPEALDPGVVRAGLGLWHDLPRDLPRDPPSDHPGGAREVLLVTDLHAANVLSAEREPWLLVDPKPHVGDAHYDVVQHLLNCGAELHADPAGLARRVAGAADLDGDRAVRWLFARCVQECWEREDLRPVARRLAAEVG